MNETTKSFFDLQTVFLRFGQGLLWLAGILAVLGLCWRKASANIPIPEQVALTVGLAVWVGCFTLLVRHFERQRWNRFRMITAWIPASLCVFAAPRPILYVASLFLVSFLWQFHAMFFVRFPNTKHEVDEIDEEIDEETFDDDIRQQITRTRLDNGFEKLEGNFLVEFDADQWTVSVHVPFCPAFDEMPKIETMLLEGDAKLNIFKQQIYGVRVDVKKANSPTDRVRILVVAEGKVSQLF